MVSQPRLEDAPASPPSLWPSWQALQLCLPSCSEKIEAPDLGLDLVTPGAWLPFPFNTVPSHELVMVIRTLAQPSKGLLNERMRSIVFFKIPIH